MEFPENLKTAIDLATALFEHRRGFKPPHLYVYLRPEVFQRDPYPSHRGPVTVYYDTARSPDVERVVDPDGAVTYVADDIFPTPVPLVAGSSYEDHLAIHKRSLKALEEQFYTPSVMFKQSCNHEYTQYTGLQETFEYCKHCDERR